MAHNPDVPHGVKFGDFVFFSAIRPPKPDGKLAETPLEQAEDVFANLHRLMDGLGGSLDDVLQVIVYVADASYVGPMNQVWAKLFPRATNPTARQVIQGGPHGGAVGPTNKEFYSLNVIAA